MGTWLTPAPSQINPQDIIAQLPHLKMRRGAGMLTAAFFLTPSFAKWLENGHSFLHDATQQIWRSFPAQDKDDQMRHIKTISAVVDRLPEPIGVELGSTPNQSSHIRKNVRAFEGIALYIYENPNEAFQTIDSRQAHNLVARLRFMTKPNPASEVQGDTQTVHSITLPAANTLFANGSKTTILLDTWRIVKAMRASLPPLRIFKHTGRRFLSSYDVDLPSDSDRPLDIYLPLERLTEARQVVSSMGNILRELKGDNDAESLPASAELEKIVPQMLERKHADGLDGALQVFALVQPAANKGQNRRWLSLSAPLDIGDTILNGARLHRVTSGGGGWGKKQGLLSLEPAVDFNAQPASSSAPWLDESEKENDAGCELLPPGSSVQFFAAFVHSQGHEAAVKLPGPDVPMSEYSKWTSQRQDRSGLNVSLGVIPSSEYLPEINFPASEDAPKFIFYSGHFGMLSESGACLETFSYSRTTGEFTVNGVMPASRSRVDVPHTNISIEVPNSYFRDRGLLGGADAPGVSVLHFTRSSGDGMLLSYNKGRPRTSLGKSTSGTISVANKADDHTSLSEDGRPALRHATVRRISIE